MRSHAYSYGWCSYRKPHVCCSMNVCIWLVMLCINMSYGVPCLGCVCVLRAAGPAHSQLTVCRLTSARGSAVLGRSPFGATKRRPAMRSAIEQTARCTCSVRECLHMSCLAVLGLWVRICVAGVPTRVYTCTHNNANAPCNMASAYFEGDTRHSLDVCINLSATDSTSLLPPLPWMNRKQQYVCHGERV